MTLSAHEIDVHVGRRLRERREALGISQGRLGSHLGLTFSQVQKYEKGSNRIGAGRLYQIAAYLGVQPDFFFDGLDAPAARSAAGAPSGDEVSPEEIRQVGLIFSSILDAGTRASVLALMRSLAEPFGRETRLAAQE